MLHTIRDTRIGRYLREKRFIWRSKKERNFFRQFIPRGSLIFDIGANRGDKASIFRSLGARVVCVEPQSHQCRELRSRFGRNPRVIIEQVAVGETPGEATMLVCSELPLISTLSHEKWERSRFKSTQTMDLTEKVAVTTLECLIAKHGLPHFCKIDVEGFELPVIKGLKSQIRFISLELNREFLPEIEECIRMLNGIAKAQFNFSEAESSSLVFPQWVGKDQLLNWVHSHPDQLLWGDVYVRLSDAIGEGHE